MTHSIALNFEDGVTRFVDCRPGETVADASYRVGINIPLDCRDGACGTCKCRVECGEYDGGDYIEDALTDEEAAIGLALACQMRPRTDLVVAIAASSEFCKTGASSIEATVRGVERLSDTTIALTIDASSRLAFLPGQYVNILVPGTDQSRSYSFSSAPDTSALSFLVRTIPGGVMTTWLRDGAAPGMPLSLVGPSGSFYLRAVTRPLLFLAGGTGLAPFLSMLEALAASGVSHPIHLVYGVTNDADLVELSRLDAFATSIPGFTFGACVASASSTHPHRGTVTAHIHPVHLNAGDVDIYLCGPPPMVDAVRSWLTAQGVEPASFYTEKFAPSGSANAARRVTA